MALEQLEAILRTQWRMGQSLALCWAFDPSELLTVVVPHYFIGNFTAPDERLPAARAIEFTDKHGLRQEALSVGFKASLDDSVFEIGVRNR